MELYDPLKAPDPDEWLALDEGERILLVEEFHKRARIRLPNRTLHAALHAVVENQIAEGSSLPVSEKVDQLMAEGLDRHDAVHAIGMVLSGTLFDVMKEKTKDDPNPKYFKELSELTAEKWRQSGAE